MSGERRGPRPELTAAIADRLDLAIRQGDNILMHGLVPLVEKALADLPAAEHESVLSKTSARARDVLDDGGAECLLDDPAMTRPVLTT